MKWGSRRGLLTLFVHMVTMSVNFSRRNEVRKIGVIGLGPIGGILAACLSSSKLPVIGVDVWDEHRKKIKERGITITGSTSVQSSLRKVLPGVTDLKKEEPLDYIFITVKTPYLKHIIDDLITIPGDFHVIAFQNGIDNEEFLGQHFPRERVMRGVINYAGNIDEPGKIRMSFFHKPNYLGCLCSNEICEHARELALLMTASGLDTEATAQIRSFAWKKTILNAGLSGLCGLLGITMAEAMSDKEASHLVESILKEAIEVAKRAGFDYGDDFLDYCIGYLSKAGHHKTSMHIDLEHGQPTEIDYINGKIVQYGQELNVPVPVNSTLTALIKAKESKMMSLKSNGEPSSTEFPAR